MRKLLVVSSFALIGYFLYKAFGESSYASVGPGVRVSRPSLIERILLDSYPFDPERFIRYRCIRPVDTVLRNFSSGARRVLRYKKLAQRWGDYWGVPWVLVLAIIGTESGGDPYVDRREVAVGDVSRGLMQLLLRTARFMGYKGSPSGLYDPSTNIYYGTKYLRYLYNKYHNWLDVIAAYNAGKPRGEGNGCYYNQRYVNKVVSWLYGFKKIMGIGG
jgi:soluble lytic murein transglycosylase-like protein